MLQGQWLTAALHTTTQTLTGHLHNFGLPGMLRTNPTLSKSCFTRSVGLSIHLASETECWSRNETAKVRPRFESPPRHCPTFTVSNHSLHFVSATG